MNYLDFEEPIKDLDKQLLDCIELGEKSDVDITETRIKIQKKLDQIIKEIYSNLSPWQKVQISRHPDRPYTLDYINSIFGKLFLNYMVIEIIRMIKQWLVVWVKLKTKHSCLLVNKKDIILKIANIGILEWLTLRVIEKH